MTNEQHAKGLAKMLSGSTVMGFGVTNEGGNLLIEFDNCLLVFGRGVEFWLVEDKFDNWRRVKGEVV